MVEVFKTNVNTKEDANRIIKILQASSGFSAINFDLDDRERILRIEASEISICNVIEIMKREHFECEILSDFPTYTPTIL